MESGRQPEWLMEKPMHLLQPQPLVLEHADNHTARFGAEVDGDISSRHAAYRIRTLSALQSVISFPRSVWQCNTQPLRGKWRYQTTRSLGTRTKCASACLFLVTSINSTRG